MTTESKPRLKITYATLRADNEELHKLYEAGLEEAKRELGGHHLNVVNGRDRAGDGEMTVASPIDRNLILGHFARGTRDDVRDAVKAARSAQPAWAGKPWKDRLELIRKAADLISERQMRYAGLMAIEVGKNRLEALGEVEEAADLLRYYAQTMEDNDGYDHPMDNLGDSAVHTRSILRPHGVFAVISPFNFPMALAAGPTAAALMAGNTVVFKPSSAAPMSGVKLVEAYRDAGFPDGVVNLVMGPGDTVGAELRENEGIDGIVFTGSYEVGMDLYRTFSKRFPKPTIVEMGGKNPAVVSRTADLEEAAEGIVRSAFGFGGQKCSANSRVYVEKPAHDELVEAAGREDRGDHDRRPAPPRELARPDRRPEGGRSAPGRSRRRPQGRPGVRRRRAIDRSRDGPRLLRRTNRRRRPAGGPSPLPRRALRAVHRSSRGRDVRRGPSSGERLGVRPDGRRLQRGSRRGQRFLDNIEAGVTYVNRRAGATTGAWPGVQAFGGWKGSGSTGKAGLSMYYVAQFLREQSHTVVD